MVKLETQEKNKKVVKVDIDGKYDSKRLRLAIRMLKSHHKLSFAYGTVWKTKHGWHIYLTSRRRLKPIEAILCQLYLGSDYKREILNWERVLNRSHGNDWNILFHSSEKFDEPKTVKLLALLKSVANRYK